MPHKSKLIKCPICGKEYKISMGVMSPFHDNKYFPFCSKRCKMIDLNRWFDASYSVESADFPSDNLI